MLLTHNPTNELAAAVQDSTMQLSCQRLVWDAMGRSICCWDTKAVCLAPDVGVLILHNVPAMQSASQPDSTPFS